MSIRVLLADDQSVVRRALRELIEMQPDMRVVGEAKDGRNAVRLAHELSPDLVVTDITMPGMNGIEATRHIAADGTKVIGVSMHADRRFVREMLKAGASGYVLKDSAMTELPDAIRTVVAGGTFLSPAVDMGVGRGSCRRAGAPRFSREKS